MNRHFNPIGHQWGEWALPQRAYGLIDDVTFIGTESAYVAIDLVDADWADKQCQEVKAFSNSLRALVEHSRASRATIKRPCTPIQSPSNPFESAPLYRLELKVSQGHDLFENGYLAIPVFGSQDFDRQLCALQSQWIELFDFSAICILRSESVLP